MVFVVFDGLRITWDQDKTRKEKEAYNVKQGPILDRMQKSPSLVLSLAIFLSVSLGLVQPEKRETQSKET